MEKILLVSHGTIAKGMSDAFDMIYGKVDNLSYLCLEKEDSFEEFKSRFHQQIEKMKPFNSLTVIADIKGGSPYTYASEYIYQQPWQEKAKVYSGLNLAMVFAAIEQQDQTIIIEAGKTAIDIFTLAIDNNDDEL